MAAGQHQFKLLAVHLTGEAVQRGLFACPLARDLALSLGQIGGVVPGGDAAVEAYRVVTRSMTTTPVGPAMSPEVCPER